MDLMGLGSIADFAGGLMDRFVPKKMTEGESAQTKVALIEILEKREASVVSSQKDIMVAELNQSDNYTKRARPSIVYFGLAVIGLNHVILPWVGWFLIEILEKTTKLPVIVLPEEFWYTWGGVCSVWVWGRTKEKVGAKNKLISSIVGK